MIASLGGKKGSPLTNEQRIKNVCNMDENYAGSVWDVRKSAGGSGKQYLVTLFTFEQGTFLEDGDQKNDRHPRRSK